MGIVKMDMSQGKIEYEANQQFEYTDEMSTSVGNPLIGLSQMLPETRLSLMPASLANIDLEVFLKKMHD